MEADLCIIMGTSLTVQPFASLPGFCEDHVPRVLINLERVGGLGSRADDVLLLGDCDTGIRRLASALGWKEDLELLWKETKSGTQGDIAHHALLLKSKDEKLDDQIANLTNEINKSLQISSDHNYSVRNQLDQEGHQDKMELNQSRNAKAGNDLKFDTSEDGQAEDAAHPHSGTPEAQSERSTRGNLEGTWVQDDEAAA